MSETTSSDGGLRPGDQRHAVGGTLGSFKVASWEDVGDSLERISEAIRDRGAESHLLFADLYTASIRQWLRARRQFADPAFVEAVVIHFYRLYAESVVHPLLGQSPVRRTALWNRYFELAVRRPKHAWSALVVLRAGVVAHVIGDLEEAFCAALLDAGPSALSGRNLQRHAQDLLGSASSKIFHAAASDYLERLSGALPGPGPTLLKRTMLSIVHHGPSGLSVPTVQRWRRRAWRRAHLPSPR